MSINKNNFYAGTSGLLLPVPNKTYYPQKFQDKSRLSYYSSLVNSIEINSSFYKIPQAITIAKWALAVPVDFKFTFKLFKAITHQKGLIFDEDLVSQFFKVIDHVRDKKGCVLVQLPPSININYFAQIRLLMMVLKVNNLNNCWKIAFEFRHPSLYCGEVFELLNEFNMGMVLHDKAKSASSFIDIEMDFVYLHFHGPDGNYKGTYDDEVLDEYASYINDWLANKKQVYVYFNNTMGNVYANLNTLVKCVYH
ncbi:MAG: DUF72 domain-containing protein [Bacteroidota bacterium]